MYDEGVPGGWGGGDVLRIHALPTGYPSNGKRRKDHGVLLRKLKDSAFHEICRPFRNPMVHQQDPSLVPIQKQISHKSSPLSHALLLYDSF
jgi:hypothetical protein